MGRPLRKPDVDVPIDPETDQTARASASRSPFPAAQRAAWPKFRLDVVVAVFVGGCLGGVARYAAISAWPAPAGRFPWSTLAVNVTGSFILALSVVIAAEVVPSRYLRPLLGTGFCGGLTTFSSVVVTADQLFGHGHVGTGLIYVFGTIAAGLAAAVLGFVAGRAAAERHRGSERRSS